MKISIGVPWRGGDPLREEAFEFVRAHLRRAGFSLTTFDDGTEPFSRAGSRNLAVRDAADAQVVILHDADMILPLAAYLRLAEEAWNSRRLVIGFDEYRPLDEQTSDAVKAGEIDPFDATPISRLFSFSCGGVIAIRPEAWWEVGGMDERYVDWGCEDFAFANASTAKLGPLIRLEGPGVHLWHPSAIDPTNLNQQRNGRIFAGGEL